MRLRRDANNRYGCPVPTTPSSTAFIMLAAAQTPKSKFKFVMLDKESNMSAMLKREEFLRICSEEDLAEMEQEMEVTISVKQSPKKNGLTSIQSLVS